MSTIIKYSSLDLGKIEAVFDKLGGIEGADNFLGGETIVIKPSWIRENAIMHLSIKSDGTTGKEWIERLTELGAGPSPCAISLLRSSDFKPTKGTNYKIVVVPGKKIGYCHPQYIYSRCPNLGRPTMEVACLIREKYTSNEIDATGFDGIAVMHEPVKAECESLEVLMIKRDGIDTFRIKHHARSDNEQLRCDNDKFGYAFVENNQSFEALLNPRVFT